MKRSLLLLAVSSLLALTLAEGWARLARPDWRPARAERNLFWEPDAQLGWVHRPDTQGRFVGPSWDVAVRINSKGLRDDEHPHERTEGARRIVLLGDSFAWGFGVEQEEAIGARLEEHCPGLEVVNGSVSGWSTDQQVLWYRREGLRYAPDEVVLLMHKNDLEGNSFARFYGYPKPYFELSGAGLALAGVPVPARSWRDRAYGFAVGRTYLGNAIRLASPSVPTLFEGPPYLSSDDRVRPEVTRRLVRAFAAEIREAGGRLVWALIPTQRPLIDWASRVAREARVPFLDLEPAFRRAPRDGEPLLLDGDPHWSAAGHDLAARTLASSISGCVAPR